MIRKSAMIFKGQIRRPTKKKVRARVQRPDDSRSRALRQCVAATMLHRVELHATEQHCQLRSVEPQLLRLGIVPRHFVTAEFQAFDVGITLPLFLWRYRNSAGPPPCWQASPLYGYRAGRRLGMTISGCFAANQELFPFASCLNRRSSSLSAHTMRCFPEGVRREWTQPCWTQ
jgi:hypothetical protein